MNKIIIFFIILTLIVGITGFWYYQQNFFSKESIKLEILSKENVSLAEEVEYIVKYKNNGNTRVENPELIFEYPEYSIVEGKELRKHLGTEELGEAIYPGEEKIFKFKARLLGKENDAKTAKAWLSYTPKNLKARYESATSFITIIKKIPLTFEFDLPSKIGAGKDITFHLNYFSNLEYPLSDLRVKILYPSEFEFISSKPSALEKTEWDIGILNKAKGGRIEIAGRIFGEPGQQKIFHAELGVWQDGTFVLLKQVFQGIELVKPSLFITQQINGNPEYIASPGDLLHYEIFFKNIGDEPIRDLFLVAKLKGEPFDFETIKSELGSFEQGDNSIIFDSRRVPKLKFLEEQEEGSVEFWIEVKKKWDIKKSENINPILINKVYLSQRKEFTTKVNTILDFSQKAYYNDEVFGNSGPVPLKIGEPTTYTIIWQVKNHYNSVRNVKIKAVLPSGSLLTGKIFPEEQAEKFAFDSESREIVWTIGDVEAGQGILDQLPSINIAFQISFTPEDSQKGTFPEIISQAEITGEDAWTGEILSFISPAKNTSLSDDDTITQEQGIVLENE